MKTLCYYLTCFIIGMVIGRVLGHYIDRESALYFPILLVTLMLVIIPVGILFFRRRRG